jgi:hypothetical protein
MKTAAGKAAAMEATSAEATAAMTAAEATAAKAAAMTAATAAAAAAATRQCHRGSSEANCGNSQRDYCLTQHLLFSFQAFAPLKSKWRSF